MLNLREQHKQIIYDLARQCFSPPIEIWAYGSRVKGNSHEASDLDLVIRGHNLAPVELNQLNSFIEQLKDSSLPILVQVFDWARLPSHFHSSILEKYEILYP